MKLKTLRPHYYESKYKVVGSVYMSDKTHGGIVVRNGSCEEVALPTRKDKKENKQHPKTRKGKLQKK